MSKSYSGILNRIKRNKSTMQKQQELEQKQQKQEQSRVPLCLTSINELTRKVEKLKTGCFSGSPDYFISSLDSIRTILMDMFKNLTIRMTGTPEVSVSKIKAAADSLSGIDEETKNDLLLLADSQEGEFLTPELISENLDTFRVIFDSSNIEANEKEIVFHADVEFEIVVGGVKKQARIEGRFPVPLANLVLTNSER